MDTVLIADDDEQLLLLIKAYLSKYRDKFEIVVARDGLEAITILKKREISLLLTDLKMPKIEGLVLLAYMNRNFPKVPCMVMTSLRVPWLKQKIQQDVLYYIEKPFDKEDLARTILSALEPVKSTLQGISIISFLQLIRLDHKTCICEIVLSDNRKGSFYFKDGVLFDAGFGELRGESAALAMIRFERAEINFHRFSQDDGMQQIRTDLSDLIMEALRQKDRAIQESGS